MNRLLLALAVLLGLAGPALAQQGIRQYPQIPAGTMIPTGSCMYVDQVLSSVWSNASLCPTSAIQWGQAFGLLPIISVGSGLTYNAATGQLTAPGSGGGSLTLTDGVHTVAGVTNITVSGGTVGGATPNATLATGGGGSGTANTLAMWITSSTLGNSPLSVSGINLVSTDALQLPVGSPTATALNFGVGGTGMYSSGGAVYTSIGGVQAQSIFTGSRILYGNGVLVFDRLNRTDTPSTGSTMSVVQGNALNASSVNVTFGSMSFVPQNTASGSETGDIIFAVHQPGFVVNTAKISGVDNAFEIYPGSAFWMGGQSIINSSLEESLLPGSAAATAYNFGTAGTGLYSSGGAVYTAIGGIQAQSIYTNVRTLYATGATAVDNLQRTDLPTTGQVMSYIAGQAFNSSSANTLYGDVAFVPRITTAGVETADIDLFATISGTNTLIAGASGFLSGFNIGPSMGFYMNGTQVLTSGRVLQNIAGISSNGSITFTSLNSGGAICASNTGLLSSSPSCALAPVAVSTSSVPLTSAEAGQLVLATNGSPTTFSLAQSTGALGPGFGLDLFTVGQTSTGTITTSTLNGASTIKLGAYQDLAIAADAGAGNYVGSASLPWPPTQSNTLLLCDDMVWRTTCAGLPGLGANQTWTGANTFNQAVTISGTNTNILIGPSTAGGGTYNGWSMNGTLTFGSSVGCVGGATGVTNMLCNVPTAGTFQFEVNATTKLTLSATALSPVDNTVALGASGSRWASINAVLANVTTATTGYVCYTSTGGVINSDNTNTCLASSMRFKHDIHNLADADALAEVMRFRPVSYRYNEGVGQGPKYLQIGQIAEDVNKVDKRLIAYDADGKTPRAIKYDEEIPLLIGAIKAQQAEIEQLKARMP